MPETNFKRLTDYAKALSSLTPQKKARLIAIGEFMHPVVKATVI